MTPEQLDKIDALVAEHVMGFRRETISSPDYDGKKEPHEVLLPPGVTVDEALRGYPSRGTVPLMFFVRGQYNRGMYTRDGNAAMEVFVAMKDRDPLLRPDGKMWMCIMDASADPNDTKTTWHDHRSYTVHRRRVDEHDADPRVVICLTALKALGVEVPR